MNQSDEADPLGDLETPKPTSIVAVLRVVGVFAVIGVGAIGFERYSTQHDLEQRQQAVHSLVRRLEAHTNVCDGLGEFELDYQLALRGFLEIGKVHDPALRAASGARDQRERRCCESRRAAWTEAVRALPVGRLRGDALGRIRDDLVRQERQNASLDACGQGEATNLLGHATDVERAIEHGAADAWRGYERVLQIDGVDRAAGGVLFDAVRRQELAALCVDGGLAAALEAHERDAVAEEVALYGLVQRCASHDASGALLTDAQRATVRTRLRSAELRLGRQEAQEGREFAAADARRTREMLRLAAACEEECAETGLQNTEEDPFACTAVCLRLHPDLAEWATLHGHHGRPPKEIAVRRRSGARSGACLIDSAARV